jgi:glutathione S-transferase
MVRIYGPSRSRSFRALWMAEECGLPFDHDDLTKHTTMADKSAAMQALSPMGKIPVLDDDGFVLSESMAINLYLARKYGRHLWPHGEQDQARVWQWSSFAVTELDPPLAQLMVERVYRKEAERNPANEQRQVELLKRPLRVLDTRLASMPWLLGQAFSVADLNVASVLHLAASARQELTDYPHANAWMKRCAARPAYVKACQRP